MNTEHVSVPRDVSEAAYWALIEFFGKKTGMIATIDLHPVADAVARAVLSRATPSIPTINIKCETRGNNVTGTATLNVVRVEAEDDGSFTAVTDHWPIAPRVVPQAEKK